jgi:hypothetical protein
MRVESAVTSISWIPSEAVAGLTRMGFSSGAVRYDDPPPDRITDLAALHAAGGFRFANHLSAWAEVQDGQVTGAGYSGRGYISHTRVYLGGRAGITFQPAEFPELRADPEVRGGEVVFVQTTGGPTGQPYPPPGRGPPFLQWSAPTVWTTLRLTIRADGSSAGELTGASPFPRHWVYDQQGQLAAKSGVAAYEDWARTAFGAHSPWGGEDAQPLVTAAESSLERQISLTIMRGGARPAIRRLPRGAVLTEQGQPGQELFLLLDGVLAVSVNGEELGQLGPGAIAGERSLLEGGRRTATLRAVTDCTVAVAEPDQVDRDKLAELAGPHHREDQRGLEDR